MTPAQRTKKIAKAQRLLTEAAALLDECYWTMPESYKRSTAEQTQAQALAKSATQAEKARDAANETPASA